MAAKGGVINLRGTIRESPSLNVEADAEKLYKAMKGLGTDEKTLTDVLTRRSNAQRQLIMKAYKTAYGRDLIDDIKSETSGSFERALVALLHAPAQYDAYEMRSAIKGAGTDEGCLSEILASRTKQQINAMSHVYEEEYGNKLEDDIASDTSSYLRRVLVALLQANRDEGNFVDQELVEKDAKELLEAGEKKWGTDEGAFIMILCVRNVHHLRRVFDTYKTMTNKDIEDSIKSETAGSFEDALLAIVKCIKNVQEFFAYKLHKSMKQGLGTDENTLIRVLVSRSEVDLQNIKQHYKQTYGEELQAVIEGDTSGDFRTTLASICSAGD
ncbi:annexin A4-like isoform X1 [Lethenteron reissneri]|uniref:annexin A4-like isoform X1 n=1 Tax=Lethenteron reissneri TaxID=7753 RepID=UPI002AB78F58|nr:annexin A4-like isoform X1 [Lethenteron reissneri]